jgi:hypothetical protein
MTVEVDVTVPATDCPFGRTLRCESDVRLRLERIVPIESVVVPYLWVSCDDIEEIRSALEGDSNVERIVEVDTNGEETLIRVEWNLDDDELFGTIADADGTIIDAVGSHDSWSLRLRFQNHARLSEWYRQCVDRDVSVSVERVHAPLGMERTEGVPPLTEPQREALVTAWERGYFEVPRKITLAELGTELGVSDTAVSQRLRRAIAGVLLSTLDRNGRRMGADGGRTATDDGRYRSDRP